MEAWNKLQMFLDGTEIKNLEKKELEKKIVRLQTKIGKEFDKMPVS